MAKLDPYLPLIAECVWRLHELHADQGWLDGHSLINMLNTDHNADLNRMYALFGNAGDPQRIGNIQIGNSLKNKLGQLKAGTVKSARQIDTPYGDRDGTCDVSAWAVNPQTTQALEGWLRRNCPDRLDRLTGSPWPTCTDPAWMLSYLATIPAGRPGRPTPRKLRLFACAAVRSAWERLPDERCRHAVEVAEQFADGLANEADLAAAREDAMRACQLAPDSAKSLARAAHDAASPDATLAAQDVAAGMRRLDPTASRLQCELLRDIFGPAPSRQHVVDPVWLAGNDGAVRRIAESVYQDRAFDHLTILRDALVDAGCANEDILKHLRHQGPHGRGDWAVDLVLGRA